ncbi:MAG: arylsulfatase [Bacteroidales bacterium]|nr:arylsulfatase [Bacteroidales bacterium]
MKKTIISNRSRHGIRKASCFAMILTLTLMVASGQKPKNQDERPNILVILVDDMGYSDLGCFGSEIRTPNLDQLAAEGIRFSNLYNTAKCHSSRVSLLSGRYPFQAGNTSLQHSVTVAEVLRESGYFTAMTGKWHLDKEPGDFGFDRYFGHLSGATNFFRGDETFRLNGEQWTVPEKDFYTTIANTDFSIRFLKEARKTDKPWFLYIAHNAPHFPLHCLEEDYEKYAGTYDVGWDEIREARAARQKEMRLFDQETIIPGRPEYIPAWKSLSEERKDFESMRMTAYSAMVDRIDQELGRLLKNIKKAGELENTLILFVSDNGGCPYERSKRTHLPPWDPDSDLHPGTAWAWVNNTPFRNYKQNQHEGGIASPAVAFWPKGIEVAPGSVIGDPIHLVDLLPTLADISNSKIPESWPDRELNPVAGISFAPTFKGESLGERTLYFLFASDRGIRLGDWKLVSFRQHPWELYNLREDPTEIHDVADRYPEIALDLEQQWYRMAREEDQAPLKSRNILSPREEEKIHPLWTDYSRKEIVPFQNSDKITPVKKNYQ